MCWVTLISALNLLHIISWMCHQLSTYKYMAATAMSSSIHKRVNPILRGLTGQDKFWMTELTKSTLKFAHITAGQYRQDKRLP